MNGRRYLCMNTCYATLILTASILGTGTVPAYAKSDSGTEMKRVEIAVPKQIAATPVGFSNAINVQTEQKLLDSNRPNIGEIITDLKTDGLRFGWIDETGAPLKMTRKGDEIIIRRENRLVSRIKMIEMAGINEPSIGSAVTAMAD